MNEKEPTALDREAAMTTEGLRRMPGWVDGPIPHDAPKGWYAVEHWAGLLVVWCEGKEAHGVLMAGGASTIDNCDVTRHAPLVLADPGQAEARLTLNLAGFGGSLLEQVEEVIEQWQAAESAAEMYAERRTAADARADALADKLAAADAHAKALQHRLAEVEAQVVPKLSCGPDRTGEYPCPGCGAPAGHPCPVAAQLAAEKRRADEAEAACAAWREWYAGLRVDFSGLTDDPNEADRTHGWGWMDSHRPAPTGADAGRTILDRLHAGEREVAELRARLATAIAADEWWSHENREQYLRLIEAECERNVLRGIVSSCCDAIGNSSFCTPLASLEFMAGVPDEIRVATRLRVGEIATLRSRVFELERAALVPGKMRCASCNFELVRTTLHVASGTANAGDNKTEPCPNGCGPLWPKTWKQEIEGLVAADEALAGHLEAVANATGHQGGYAALPAVVQELTASHEKAKAENLALRSEVERLRAFRREVTGY